MDCSVSTSKLTVTDGTFKPSSYRANLWPDLRCFPGRRGETAAASWAALGREDADIGTVVTPTTSDEERLNPNVVKAVGTPIADRQYRALYFSRSPVPFGDGDCFHHIGIYSFRRDSFKHRGG